MKIEPIPDTASLYRRAYKGTFNPRKNKFTEAAFMLRKDESFLSVNWDKYTTPEESSVDPFGRIFCVGELKAKIPRDIDLDVIHMPSKGNESHSAITGQKLLDEESAYEVAGILADNCKPIVIS